MLKAFNVMTTDVTSVAHNTPLEEVAGIMLEKGIGSLLVEKGGKNAGIVTDRDFVKLTAQGKDAKKAGDISSSPLIKVQYDSELIEVIKAMAEHRVRHVLVEEDRKVIGVITPKDIIVSAPEFILSFVMEKLTDFDIPSFR